MAYSKIKTKKNNPRKVINKKRITGHTRKTRVKTYKILDNGLNPFIVDITPKRIVVYRQLITSLEKGRPVYERDKKEVDTPYKNVFIGDNLLNYSYGDPKGRYPGNSILIEIGKGHYIYVGDGIYSFETHNNEQIKHYYSPVGNSGVPYPYAIGENNTYFMLDKKSLPNDMLDLKKHAYTQFYGVDVKDGDIKKMEASKKKFKTKQIQKRFPEWKTKIWQTNPF